MSFRSLMCQNKSLMFTIKKGTSHYLLTLSVIKYWHLSFTSNKASSLLQSWTIFLKKKKLRQQWFNSKWDFYFFTSGSRWPAWSFFLCLSVASKLDASALFCCQSCWKVFAQGETSCESSTSIRASYSDLILFKNKHQAPVAVQNKS